MKKFIGIFMGCLIFLGCNTQEPTKFSEEALNDTFMTLNGESIAFKDLLQNHKGSNVVIDIWASWCKDCVGGMPKVKKLQKEHQDVTYIFLSLDKNVEAWKKGIEKYDVKGEHYFMSSGWKGPFGSFVNLDWIPRYMVVDKEGHIKLYKAVEADDTNIKDVL
ncbi:MAG: TlpA family protein disulfide reductase [Flavobacteriales bacterium]|nr:TlpA family protein disulfide reductase [Flavobacteriia bacterium]NCP06943.1 TlpA family protein disulfide reductase [Flavobacteriales bacterium]PIV93977.1 MAG: redoxin [Flavobacteriaceae bacterium CG17_big_fil_post_rev_8_21_14_2_50_33_15]PIY11673.1 MAG: redoxin [Flavobacteriaceae bacterium CG_4_10_14_3_um_filter_33_47]PJB16624.1 MAG: redoxin [Flavobacteriaceae bacterium CG_4_9_14_3_um_filter_33_16]